MAADSLRRELQIARAVLAGALQATTNATLISTGRLRAIELNEPFAAMWSVPAEVMHRADMEELQRHVQRQLPDPGAYRRRCDEIVLDARAPSEDILQLTDGRAIERRSRPLLLRGEPFGRVWSFADATREKQAEEALRSETHVLGVVNAMGRKLASKLSLAAVVRSVLDAGMDISGGTYGTFLPRTRLPPAGPGDRACRVARGEVKRFRPLQLHVEQSLADAGMRWERTLCCQDLWGTHETPACLASRPAMPRGTARSLLFIPVGSRTGETLGALLFTHESPRMFSARTVDNLSGLAAHAAVAMDNASLYHRLSQQVAELQLLLRLQQSHLRTVRNVSRRLMRTEEDQAKRLGRELHDRVGGNLGALLLAVTLIRKEMHGKPMPLLASRLQSIEDTLHGTLRHVKDLLADVRPACLDELGLLAALRHRADVLTRTTEVEFTIGGEEFRPRLSAQREMAFYRIAQEAWNNVLKHANASHARLTLSAAGGKLVMEIEDDGTGFLPRAGKEAAPSLGMTTMRERAEAIGAMLQVGAPATGTGAQLRLVSARKRSPGG